MSENGIKISGLTAASSVNDADVLAGVQSGTTKKFSFSTIKSWIQGWLTKADVGLSNVANVLQYSANNKPTPADIGAAADNTVAIVETGENASQNLTVGQYVIWQGALYTANQNVSAGTALSGKLTAVSGGGLNDLKSDVDASKTMTDLGSFSTLAGLGALLDGVLADLPENGSAYIQVMPSAVIPPFVSNNRYCGTVYKVGTSTAVSCAYLFPAGLYPPVFCRRTADGWSYNHFAVGETDDITSPYLKTFNIVNNSSADFYVYNNYSIAVLFVIGYTNDGGGLYLLTRALTSLIKTEIKAAAGITITFSASTITIANASGGTVLAALMPMKGRFK